MYMKNKNPAYVCTREMPERGIQNKTIYIVSRKRGFVKW